MINVAFIVCQPLVADNQSDYEMWMIFVAIANIIAKIPQT